MISKLKKFIIWLLKKLKFKEQTKELINGGIRIGFEFFIRANFEVTNMPIRKEVERVGKLRRIVDGDTIVIETESEIESLRIAWIDAPEDGQRFAKESTDFLKKIFESDLLSYKQIGKDRYGRTIALVYTDKGHDISEKMLEHGWAYYYKNGGNNVRYIQAEMIARREQLGLWKYAGLQKPWEYRKKKNRI